MSTPQSRIHADWRHAEAGRAAFCQDFTRRLDTIKRCALWLAERGVITVSIDARVGSPGKPVLVVPPSPYLHILFKDECSAGRHWDNAQGRTAHDFVAVTLGCEIHWSEVAQ